MCQMWSILLALTCLHHTAADVPIQAYLDPVQLAGRWYPISLVMDYEDRGSLSVAGRTIIPIGNGNLDVDFESFENGHCILRMDTFWRTNMQGKFMVDRGFTIRIVETDYDDYLIFHLEAVGKSALHLDARRRSVSDRVRQKFKDIVSSLGFPVDKILDVPKYDSCP
ncbi:lipocalin Can f 6.0101 isoform X1 [Pogona vitticeps]